MLVLRLSLNKSSNLVLFDPQLLWGTKDEIQLIPPFKWFSLLLVPVPNSSPGSSQCLALPYFVGATSTNSLMIKLQPKIYDHIMLTVRISFIPSVCSQVPVIVIRLPEPRGLSVETSTNNRRFLMVFPLLTAALSTPPDIWCQIVAHFLISSIIELAISVASIVQVREEGWTSGMRESGSIDKRGVAPLEPGKVTLNEFQSNSQPTYAIHSRKDEKTQKTPYRWSEMSDTSGALPLF
ncbi:hypothetical protein IFM89_000059 [Coptis chinensis]|uniref:Uncharacterized protein n=1 Tax=Coptis chinensis TaxID=261450 RepID=A0A835M3T8_9MAGN|nr:hypothetical protein IFM89_000059 [Coptis chinensis]